MTDNLFIRPLFDWRSAVASAHGPTKPTTRHVLLTLSLHMSVKGDSCFPSIDLLAEESGLSRRAVIEHLAIAEATGWIAKQERPERNGQGWRRMEYSALIPPGIEDAMREPRRKGGAPAAPPQGGDRSAEGGDFDDTKVVTDDHPSTPLRTSRGRTPPKGPSAPPATAECWRIYSEGIKARYGIEPPRNAKANGQLSQVVGRVGAEHAPRIVAFYLAHQDPFYQKVNHSLDYLVRDCDKRLWTESHKAAGRAAPAAPTKAAVTLISEAGKPFNLQDYPIGNAIDIAKQAVRDYSTMVARTKPKYIAVTQGNQRAQYALEELR